MKNSSYLQGEILITFTLVFGLYGISSAAENWQLFSTVASGVGTSNQNTFASVNPQTGQMTQLGPLGGTPQQGHIDMDPVTGFLFGVNRDTKPGVITRINPANGQWAELATIRKNGFIVNLTALSFAPNGTLYGISSGRTLGIINIGSSTFSSISDLDIPNGATGMDFSPQGVLYIADSYGSGETFQQCLRTVNPLTGTITSTIPTGDHNIGDIDYAPDGYIYHTNYSWWLFKIDPSTGVQIDFENSGGLGPFGGIASTPEPSAILLFGFGWPIVTRLRKK